MDRDQQSDDRVSQHPPDMREHTLETSRDDGTLHFDCMYERKHVTERLEPVTEKADIEPYAGQPSGQIRQQCTAYTSDLFIVQYASTEQTYRDDHVDCRLYND